MRCAMIERILVMGTSSPGSAGEVEATAGAAGGVADAEGAGDGVGIAAAATGAAEPAPFSLRNLSASSFVMRPPEPVPGICLRSRLLSRAMRRTSGEDRRRSASVLAEVAASGVLGAG